MMRYYLKWMPSKLESKEIKFSKEEFLHGDLLELHIERTIDSFSRLGAFQTYGNCLVSVKVQ